MTAAEISQWAERLVSAHDRVCNFTNWLRLGSFSDSSHRPFNFIHPTLWDELSMGCSD